MTLFLSEKYLQEGVRKDGGTEQKTTFIRAAGDIKRYKPPKTIGIGVT